MKKIISLLLIMLLVMNTAGICFANADSYTGKEEMNYSIITVKDKDGKDKKFLIKLKKHDEKSNNKIEELTLIEEDTVHETYLKIINTTKKITVLQYDNGEFTGKFEKVKEAQTFKFTDSKGQIKEDRIDNYIQITTDNQANPNNRVKDLNLIKSKQDQVTDINSLNTIPPTEGGYNFLDSEQYTYGTLEVWYDYIGSGQESYVQYSWQAGSAISVIIGILFDLGTIYSGGLTLGVNYFLKLIGAAVVGGVVTEAVSGSVECKYKEYAFRAYDKRFGYDEYEDSTGKDYYLIGEAEVGEGDYGEQVQLSSVYYDSHGTSYHKIATIGSYRDWIFEGFAKSLGLEI